MPKGYAVQFEQVNFSYDADKATLKNIDFSVPQNSFYRDYWHFRLRQNYLTQLLLRFWDVDSGKITLGDADIRHMEQDQLMKYCSVVFQDNFLFSCSIAENIAYGIENVTEEAIINAAKQARIHDFIMTLPEQYQTKVGERGQLLSGGQKQRISIARAFLQNRPILLLDEPTAFSDAKNEADLMQAFHALMQNKTVIMVAHRLSNITQADQNYLFRERKNHRSRQSPSLVANQCRLSNPLGRISTGKILDDTLENVMQSYFNPETQRVKSLWQTYHALFAAAQQQQSAFLRCLAFAALSATLFGVAIGLLYPLLLALEQTEAGQSAVIFWSVLCGVLLIASLLSRIRAEYYDTKGDSFLATYQLRRQLGEKLRRVSLAVLSGFRAGELSAVAIQSINEATNYAFSLISILIYGIVTPVSAALCLCFFDYRFGLLIFIIFPLIVPLYLWRRKAFRRGFSILAEANQRLKGETIEFVQGLEILKSTGKLKTNNIFSTV